MNTAERVRDVAASVLAIDPSTELDARVPLREHCFGLFQLDLAEIILEVEQVFGIQIHDNDWARSSTPVWEDCSVHSIAEIVERKLLSPATTRAAVAGAPLDLSAATLGDRIEFLRQTATSQMRNGNPAGASEALEIAFVLADEGSAGAIDLVLGVLRDLLEMYHQAGSNYSEACARRPWFPRAIELCLTEARDTTPSLIETLALLGKIERDVGQIEMANALLEVAIVAAKKTCKVGDPRAARLLTELGVGMLDIGELEKADAAFQSAVGVLQSRNDADPSEVLATLKLQADAFIRHREYDRAEHLLETRVAITRRFAPHSRRCALTAAELARLQFQRRDYNIAQAILRDAINLMIDVVVAPARRDEIEREFNSSPTAIMAMRHALEREAAIYDPEVREMLHDLAVSYHETGPPGLARERYERVLSIYQEFGEPRALGLADLLSNIGSFFVEHGSHDKGIPLLERSLAMLEEKLGAADPNLGPALHNLGSAYRAVGNRDDAASVLLGRCIEVRERHLGPMHESLAMPLRTMAYAKADLGLRDQAIGALERAVEIEESRLASLISQGSEEQKERWVGLLDARTNATLSFHAQYGPDDARTTSLAWMTVLRLKGRASDALAASISRLRERGEQEDLRLLRLWTGMLNDEANWFAARSAASAERTVNRDQEFDALRFEREDAERQIVRRAAAGGRFSLPRIDVKAVQERIDSRSALLEFRAFAPVDLRTFLLDESAERCGVFILRSTGPPVWLDLGPTSVINAAVEQLRRAWTRSELVWQAAARELDRLLLDPVRTGLDRVSNLLVVPDGQLFNVPFSALVDSRGRYEIYNFRISYLTTARDLLRSHRAPTTVSPPLILAAPDFDTVATTGDHVPILRAPTGASFEPLDGALDEGLQLQRIIPGSVLHTGVAASKMCLWETSSPSILHIASHAYWRPDSRDKMEKELYAFSGAPQPSPLLRAGIALAEANRHAYGLLTALEAAALDLRGTELVTLSACETGHGELSFTEGVFGLRRAFIQAGAESLIVALFSVPDDVTQRLMCAFYKDLLTGVGRGDALRDAQVAIIEMNGHPIEWAAFIVIGSSAPMSRTDAWGVRI